MRGRFIGPASPPPRHAPGSTGYGHEDEGRIALDELFAQLVGAEAALVRPQFFSGTHTIACALYGTLRPGDELLALVGHPYDTLEEVIGLRGRAGDGSLRELGVSYREVALAPDGGLDWPAIRAGVLRPETRVVLIQRSRGYAQRPTLTVDEIGRAVVALKQQRPDVAVFVDNCYGEFTETREPTAVGADLIMGSLIKNPGGTIVPCGGYVAGGAQYVANASARLCAPGIGARMSRRDARQRTDAVACAAQARTPGRRRASGGACFSRACSRRPAWWARR